ncbi:MAG TPA: class I SAM-dependent methyltransferase [Polyangiaceae bacterium]
MQDEDPIGFADFERYFARAPIALCIKECARLSVMRHYDCPEPILDVGCGDGLFTQLAFAGRQVWGIDIDAAEGRRAHDAAVYEQVILGDVTRAHLPAAFFGSCVANCSLEHIPRIGDALKNIHDSLRPGAEAFLFVPSRDWASYMLLPTALRAIGAPSIAHAVTDKVDSIFNHHHLYDKEGWSRLVRAAGFELVTIDPVLSTATTVAFELFLAPSLLGLLNKKLTSRWTNFPALRKLGAFPAFLLAQAALSVGDRTPTAEFLVRVRRP